MTGAVLLDLDGTLIDSHPGILASCDAMLRQLGHEPHQDLAATIRRSIGPPLEVVLQTLLQSYSDTRVTEAAAIYRRHYGESGLLDTVPYAGVGESLAEMKGSGLGVYLATSKRAFFANRILNHLNFTRYFDDIHGSGPNGELEQKPELVAHIQSKHRLPPAHTVVVGDRRHDIAAAHANGMRGIGVLWGYGTRAELESAGADLLLESPAQLGHTVLALIDGTEPQA